MNRAERRKQMFGIKTPSTNGYTRQYHELDDDGCCIHCGIDAAEEYHIRMSIPEHSRPAKPDWAKYCDKRPLVKLEDF